MKSPLLLVIGLGIILISYTVLINRDESADLQLAGVWTYGAGGNLLLIRIFVCQATLQ